MIVNLRIYIFFIILFTIPLLLKVNAEIPRLFPYQGILKDRLGNPKPDRSYNFTFRLFISKTGGEPIWMEVKTLSTTNGHFHTFLGDKTAFPDSIQFDRQLWLTIQTDDDPERELRVLLPSGFDSFYSIYANTAEYLVPNESITNAHISPTAQIADTKISGSGRLVRNLNADMLDGMHASELMSAVSQVVRGVIAFNGRNYEMTQYFSTFIVPSKSFVVLSPPVVERPKPIYERGEYGHREAVAKASCLISLTSNSITVAIDEPTSFEGLIPHYVSYQIIEYR